jgi:aminoglycoside 3-N-acetyltransferase I
MKTLGFEIVKLAPEDHALMNAALDCFGDVFGEIETYKLKRPSKEYLTRLISGNSFICLVAVADHKVIGALAAYELKKFEQERSEVYIYDLAVYERYRRKGVATALIEVLKPIAIERGAWVIYVQADYVDEPAVALYSKLGTKEEVLHFDIPVITQKST